MNLRLQSAFILALGLHAALGAWLSSAMIVPEQPLVLETPKSMEIDLTAPAAEPPPVLETPPEASPPDPSEEPPPPPEPETEPTPSPAPEPIPEPPPKIIPQATPAPAPERPSAKTAERRDKPRATAATSSGNAPAATTRPATASGPSTGPVCISKPDPTYPAALEERGIGGTVTVLLTIDANGRVTDAAVAASSNQPALDRAALTGVRRWRFRPALRNGQPLATSTRINVVFRAP